MAFYAHGLFKYRTDSVKTMIKKLHVCTYVYVYITIKTLYACVGKYLFMCTTSYLLLMKNIFKKNIDDAVNRISRKKYRQNRVII